MAHRPTDSVRIVIFDISDPSKFLIVAEADDPTNWKLPGGKFNDSESVSEAPEEAATRELKEELGLEGAAISLRLVDTLINEDGVSARYIFSAQADPQTVQPTSEVAAMQWVAEDTIPVSQNQHHMATAVAAARRAAAV